MVSSTEGGTETDYLFDGAEVIGEKSGNFDATSYTRGLGGRAITRRAGTDAPSYYHYDSVGSVTALSGEGGALTDSSSYDAFG